jgi:hypothetical protein
VASRWPQRLALAALISRSTSASVRYSRVRRSAFGRRFGGTVPITERGDTNLSCAFAMRSPLCEAALSDECSFLGQLQADLLSQNDSGR